jgi:hypothetical protein
MRAYLENLIAADLWLVKVENGQKKFDDIFH